MAYKIAFWISITVNVILAIAVGLLAYFKGGINTIIADSITRRRDKKESEQRSLKLSKSVLARLSRYTDTINTMIEDGSASISEKEFDQLLDRFEKTKIELEKELINCPGHIESKVIEFRQKSEEMTAKIIKEKNRSGMMNPTFLRLYTTSTSSSLAIVMAEIDKALKRK